MSTMDMGAKIEWAGHGEACVRKDGLAVPERMVEFFERDGIEMTMKTITAHGWSELDPDASGGAGVVSGYGIRDDSASIEEGASVTTIKVSEDCKEMNVAVCVSVGGELICSGADIDLHEDRLEELHDEPLTEGDMIDIADCIVEDN